MHQPSKPTCVRKRNFLIIIYTPNLFYIYLMRSSQKKKYIPNALRKKKNLKKNKKYSTIIHKTTIALSDTKLKPSLKHVYTSNSWGLQWHLASPSTYCTGSIASTWTKKSSIIAAKNDGIDKFAITKPCLILFKNRNECFLLILRNLVWT